MCGPPPQGDGTIPAVKGTGQAGRVQATGQPCKPYLGILRALASKLMWCRLLARREVSEPKFSILETQSLKCK